MRNTLGDLNNHLFAELERLSDETLSPEELKIELQRAEGIKNISQQIIANAIVVLKSERYKIETIGAVEDKLPKMLGGGVYE